MNDGNRVKISFNFLDFIDQLTLQEGGLLKPPPEQNRQFKHLLVIQLSQKIWLFPEPYGAASHILLGAWNSQKKGFL